MTTPTHAVEPAAGEVALRFAARVGVIVWRLWRAVVASSLATKDQSFE
jgi:hypothetical protein